MVWHHYQIKGMAYKFDDFFESVADYMLFECNEKEEVPGHLLHHAQNKLISIKDYVERQEKREKTRWRSSNNILLSGEGRHYPILQIMRGQGVASP